jgi:hypothetical protein
MCTALVIRSAPAVAPREVRAEALFRSALLIFPTKDERVKSTAALSHVDVQALNLMAALNMRVHEAFALVIHCMATMDGVVVCVNTSTEAVLCEATHVLLVYLVPLLEGLLDVLDEHAADGLQSILDVLVKFPGRL